MVIMLFNKYYLKNSQYLSIISIIKSIIEKVNINHHLYSNQNLIFYKFYQNQKGNQCFEFFFPPLICIIIIKDAFI